MSLPTKEYYKIISTHLAENGNPTEAAKMAKYMRHKFEFYGIKAPIRRTIQKAIIQEYGMPTLDQLEDLVDLLWADKHREMQHFAMDLIDKHIKKVDLDFLKTLERLIITKSWWDTVDMLANRHVGHLGKRFPEIIPTYPDNWMASNNMWLQRTAIIFQLKYKEHTNIDLALKYILQLKGSKEFFIQKASGWFLREYSRTDWELVVDFIENNDLAPLTKREGLKWLKKQGVL